MFQLCFYRQFHSPHSYLLIWTISSSLSRHIITRYNLNRYSLFLCCIFIRLLIQISSSDSSYSPSPSFFQFGNKALAEHKYCWLTVGAIILTITMFRNDHGEIQEACVLFCIGSCSMDTSSS